MTNLVGALMMLYFEGTVPTKFDFSNFFHVMQSVIKVSFSVQIQTKRILEKELNLAGIIILEIVITIGIIIINLIVAIILTLLILLYYIWKGYKFVFRKNENKK